MERRRILTIVTVVLTSVVMGALSVLAAGALLVSERETPSGPRPIVDRSQEIEWIVSATFGDELDATEIRLVRNQPVLAPVSGSAAPRSGSGRRGWRYDGWFRLKGHMVRVPLQSESTDDAVLAEIDRLRTMVGDAGGATAFAQVVGEFERSLPNEDAFYPVSYTQTFLQAECNRPRHARIPRLIANRYGEFDPRRILYHQPPGATLPTAVFAWNSGTGQWRLLGGEKVAAIFENIGVHDGCDVAEEFWYVERRKEPGTKVLAY